MAVLGTKLRPPVAQANLVDRGRLLQLLNLQGEAAPRLVLISAPAGFGKTTLLSQWLGSASHALPGEQMRVAWLSLDRADTEPYRFALHLVHALQQAQPNVGHEALALLETTTEPLSETVLVSIVNDLDVLADATALILDDYHQVDDPAIHAAVGFLLESLPPHVLLVISTRADPPLPLPRLRARGQLLEIRAADLRFTVDEAHAFLAETMQLDLDRRQVESLDARTEGWAAGLQLAGLAARRRSRTDDISTFVDGFSGSHRFVLDYLIEDVLHGLDEPTREFLLAVCIPDAVNGSLADALTGRDDGRAVLRALERSNLFVVPLDDTEEWFRFHHLFADALRAQAGFRHPEHVAVLHARAARWYAENGMLSDAIEHAIADGDAAAAADLIEHAIAGLRKNRSDRTLRGWLAGIPDDVGRGRPLLAAHRAWACLSEGDLVGTEGWLDAADRALAAAPTPLALDAALPADLVAARRAELRALPSLVEVYRAALAQARGDLRGTLTHARRGLALAEPDAAFSRGAAAGYVGLAAWAEGDLHTGIPTFADAVASLRRAGNAADVLGATVVLSSMWLAQGRPDEAERLCRQALADAERHAAVSLPVTGDLHVVLAGLLAERGDDSAAEENLSTAQALGDAASLLENRHRWYTTKARVLQSRGDDAGALDMLDTAASLHLPGFFPDLQPISAITARVWIRQGRIADAEDWARRWPFAPAPVYQDEYARLTVARLAIASFARRGERDAIAPAEASVSEVLAAAEAADRPGSILEALIVRSLIHDVGGRTEAALADLERALGLGVPVGYAQVFLDEGARMTALLQVVAGRGHDPAATYAKTLLSRAATDGPPRRSLADEPLSGREHQVLRLMSSTMSGPEIARHLHISLNTLRTHSKHIFTKLDVSTRLQAVDAARTRDLL